VATLFVRILKTAMTFSTETFSCGRACQLCKIKWRHLVNENHSNTARFTDLISINY